MTDLIPNKYEAKLRGLFLGILEKEGPTVALQKWNDFFPGGAAQDQSALEELLGVPAGSLSPLYVGTTPGPSPSPQPGPVPAPTGDWRDKLNRPMKFFDFPAYRLSEVPRDQIRPWLTTMIRDLGVTGPEIEFCGSDPIHEYNTKKPTDGFNLVASYNRQFEAMHYVLPIVRELGGVTNVKIIQANWSQPKIVSQRNGSDQWAFDLGFRFAQEFGSANILVLNRNETDSRFPESIGAAIRAGLIAGGFPEAQLIDYAKDGPGGFWEHHPKDISAIKDGDHRLLNVSDNGDMIEILYGNDWKNGGHPNTSRIQEYARRCKALGTSCSIYSFRGAVDPVGLKAYAQA